MLIISIIKVYMAVAGRVSIKWHVKTVRHPNTNKQSRPDVHFHMGFLSYLEHLH